MKTFFLDRRDDIEERILGVDRGSLLIIGHSVGVNINLVDELDMYSDILRRMSEYSRRMDIVIICGIVARVYRREYLSAVVIDRGKILGISDMTHRVHGDMHYNLGASYRMYKTSLGTFSIVVGDDVYYPEVVRALSSEKSDAIVILAGEKSDERLKKVISTHSYLCGISVICLSDGRAIVTNRHGDIVHSDVDAPCNMILSRDMTFYRALRSDIYDNVYIEE